MSWLSAALTWAYSTFCFTVERNVKKLRLQSLAIPRYSFHYGLNREKEAVNSLIVEAICEADREVAKVVKSWTPESETKTEAAKEDTDECVLHRGDGKIMSEETCC